MIYFDHDIIKGMEEGHIKIDPFIRRNLGPNSYDVRLGPKLLTYRHLNGGDACLDMQMLNPAEETIIPQEGLVLKPGVLYLGSTMESVGTTERCVPHIEGRSSVGRLGMGVHVTAGFGDCGFVGHWTLEITVVHPLRVYAGARVAQAYFIEGKTAPMRLYKDGGKYHSFDGPVASRMFQDAVQDNYETASEG